GGWRRWRASCNVDEDVYRPKRIFDGLYALVDHREVRQIPRQGKRSAAFLVDLVGGAIDRLRRDITQRDIDALRRQCLSDGAAEAAPRTKHESGLAADPKIHSNTP